ncbi:MAG: cytochrome P450/oxidoreductase [Gemmobacter sp.]
MPPVARCPFSDRARGFDPFSSAFQADPYGSMAWAREDEPVFFSEAMGHWVVTRHADIKEVFRDPITFSPANALEKLSPTPPEAQAILARHGFDLRRTLVNEDEPVHMERRRLLLDAFAPDRLAAHAPMVRRLVRDRIDAMAPRGEADLVRDLLWDVPLTVALHFLGVPEDDANKLRRFSVAHTVNTWGYPRPEEQIAVAEAVGRFWTYSGEVLRRMRAQPGGHGWMFDMIAKNRSHPHVVTDNFLHSMMMAIIVAAHETTALSATNAFRHLLGDRSAWRALCADPGLIPNAVEECLRHSGATIGWRRIATRAATVGGVGIPAGGRLYLLIATANRDPRRFENPDAVDLWRDNAAEHLTFGYGAHQCMGKNLGRMEIRIMLEEVTRRLPHMELVPDQRASFLPNLAFRGPEALHVRWDPALNPRRTRPALDFAVGAPDTRTLVRQLRVIDTREEAPGVMGVLLGAADGTPLPDWTPGAHLDLVLPSGDTRRYSLCGDAADAGRWRIAILREETGRGGSRWLHENLRPGLAIAARGPRNHFRLDRTTAPVILIAGGIGITPILAMADRLRAEGADYVLHYCGRHRAGMAFLDRLQRDHPGALHLHVSEEGTRLDPDRLIASAVPGTLIAACGPARLLDALSELAAARPDLRLRIEHFAPASPAAPADAQPFEAELADSALRLAVPADRTLLQTLRAAGIDIASDCEEGLCGSCAIEVLAGEIDHRDRVLTAAERAAGTRIIACCSRSRDGGRLTLRL